MEWYVYAEDINSRRMEPFNIFDHGRFLKECKDATKKYKDDKEAFIKEVRSSMMYYYWSKADWEIVLTPLICPERGPTLKIDVYDQVMLNGDRFFDYIWENRFELLPKPGRPRKKA